MSYKAARLISNAIKQYPFSSFTAISTGDGGKTYVVSFPVTTTKTRASSIATRLELISRELLPGYDINISKLTKTPLTSDLTRDSLLQWTISVSLKKKEYELRRRNRKPLNTPGI